MKKRVAPKHKGCLYYLLNGLKLLYYLMLRNNKNRTITILKLCLIAFIFMPIALLCLLYLLFNIIIIKIRTVYHKHFTALIVWGCGYLC